MPQAPSRNPIPRRVDAVKLDWVCSRNIRKEAGPGLPCRRAQWSPTQVDNLDVRLRLGLHDPEMFVGAELERTFDLSLKALLVRNKDAFRMWRYLQQEARLDRVTRFDYEFRRLSVVCQVLHDILVGSLPPRELPPGGSDGESVQGGGDSLVISS